MESSISLDGLCMASMLFEKRRCAEIRSTFTEIHFRRVLIYNGIIGNNNITFTKL